MRSGQPRSEPSRPPLSQRVCDASTLSFAAFTLCCHAVVAAGGALVHLLWLCAVALGGWLLVWLYRRERPPRTLAGELSCSSDPHAGAVPPASAPAGITPALRLAGACLGLGVLGLYVQTENVLVLWLGSVVLLATALGSVLRAERGAPPAAVPPEGGPHLEWSLWGLAFACLVLVAVIHRSDHDTPFYVGLAVSAADFPSRELMLDPIHGIDGLGLHQPAHRIHTIEIFSGAIAYLTGLSAFWSVQAVTSSLAALLVPLAFARLFRVLTPRAWLASVVVALVVLIAAAGPNWYGNFSLVRMVHGKSVFLSVFLPLCWAYGICFGRDPSSRRFALLCAAQIAAVGTTSSALWCAPVAAGLGVACAVPVGRRAVPVLALGLASSVYVVLVGLSLIGDMGAVAEAVEPSPQPGRRLRDAIAWTLPEARLASAAWGAMLVAWTLRTGVAQRFALIVPLGVLLLVLNPFLEDEVRRYATGPAYRRAMWALPLPVLMTLVLTAPRAVLVPRRVGFVLMALVTLLYVLLVPERYGLSEANRVTLGAPRLKVHPREYPPAERLNAAAPPGSTVLAPQGIALWLPSLHDHPPILYARESYLQRIRMTFGPREVEARMRLSEAVSARGDVERKTRESAGYRRRREQGISERWFRDNLRHYDIRAVSLNENAAHAARIRAAMVAEGFVMKTGGGGYEEWIRESPWRSESTIRDGRTIAR